MTQRLVLRHMEERDFDDMAAMLADPIVMRYYPSVRDREGPREFMDWVFTGYRQEGTSLWVVELETDGTFLGVCGVIVQHVDDRRDYEVGYIFNASAWGKGYATEAARASRDYAFAKFHPDRVVSFIKPANERSQGVARRNGMRILRRLETNRWNEPVDVWGLYARDYAPGPG